MAAAIAPGASQAPDAWQAAGQTVHLLNHLVFYREEGSHEGVVLLLHGFPTASWDWHRVWPRLQPHYRLVAPDLLGFGFSAKPRGHAYSILEQADLVEALLDGLGVPRVHVLAHDYGDTVAQELLARAEDRRAAGTDGVMLASVCFLNGGLFAETHRPRLIQKLLLSPLGPLLARAYTRRAFGRNFSAVFGPATQPTEAELDHYWTLLTQGGGRAIVHRLLHYLRERVAYRERWVGAMTRTPTPLRLINGPADPVSGQHMVDRYRTLIPQPDVVVLDGIGHYPQMEAPEAVADAYLAFAEPL